MRAAPEVPVFSGMIGVTLFGILFTPVFHAVARWFTARSGKGEGKGPRRFAFLT
jgi:hypothetical protein